MKEKKLSRCILFEGNPCASGGDVRPFKTLDGALYQIELRASLLLTSAIDMNLGFAVAELVVLLLPSRASTAFGICSCEYASALQQGYKARNHGRLVYHAMWNIAWSLLLP